MHKQKLINKEKHISEDSPAEDKFLTEKQRRLIEYHFAVKRSLGLQESEEEMPNKKFITGDLNSLP